MRRPAERLAALLLAAGLSGGAAAPLSAQGDAAAEEVARERREFAEWLRTGAGSPYSVLLQRAIGRGLTLGPPEADVPLAGLPPTRVVERDGVPTLFQGTSSRPVPRNRTVPLDGYRIRVTGPAGRGVLTVFSAAPRDPRPAVYYPYDPAFAVPVTLSPPARPAARRLLTADGLEVEAGDAGTVAVLLGGVTTTLQVYRIPDPTGEEADLEIYFRDETNDSTTYPAGRFVTLIPRGGNRYLLDFNRARNPFCAYSTAFACPLPWRGNTLPLAVRAGERYDGGGLKPPGLDAGR